MPIEDKILKAARNGNSDAFETLVKQYEKRVYGYCKVKTLNNDDALDLSQDIFIKLYKALPNFRGDCSFSTFLYKIMSTCACDYLKRIKKEETTPIYDEEGEPVDIESNHNVEKEAEARELEKEIIKALNYLNEEQRECFVLRDINGYTYEEIALMTGADSGTVKTRIFRARKRIREIIFGDGNKSKNSKSNILKGDD